MTRNITILFLTLLLCACTKDETVTPIRATYQTEYEDGKTYVQTFYLSENMFSGWLYLRSIDTRLWYSLQSYDIDHFLQTAPCDEALARFWKDNPNGYIENTDGPHPLLVIDLKFTYKTNNNPLGPWEPPFFVENVSCVSRWRLVEAIKVRYDIDGSERFREEIQTEVCSYPFRLKVGNKNAKFDNSITDYQYGEWYRQDFQLTSSYQRLHYGETTPELTDEFTEHNHLTFTRIETYNPTKVVPKELIRKLKSLCTNKEVPAEGFDRMWKWQLNNTYRIRAEHLFRYPGDYYLSENYFERKSDWKLERLTFDSNVLPPQSEWIAYDGIDPRVFIVGQWKTNDNTPSADAYTLTLLTNGDFELTTGNNSNTQFGRYTLENNNLIAGTLTCRMICFDKTGDVMTYQTMDDRTVILYRQK